MKKLLIISWLMLIGITQIHAQSAISTVIEGLKQVRSGSLVEAQNQISYLSDIPVDQLKDQLSDPRTAKAFWINYYNLIVQVLLLERPERYLDRDHFFSEKWVRIGETAVSLDDIEHGIIRGSRNKYTLGYTQKLFVSEFEADFRLDETDYRVHFALNCGAASCPPIAIYHPDKISDQLDEVTRLYLQKEVKYTVADKEIYVPRLCQWFYADFGGQTGIYQMLKEYLYEPEITDDLNIEYLEYDWTLSTSNFIDLDIR